MLTINSYSTASRFGLYPIEVNFLNDESRTGYLKEGAKGSKAPKSRELKPPKIKNPKLVAKTDVLLEELAAIRTQIANKSYRERPEYLESEREHLLKLYKIYKKVLSNPKKGLAWIIQNCLLPGSDHYINCALPSGNDLIFRNHLLIGSNFSDYEDMRRANFDYAFLCGAKGYRSNLDGSTFRHADLREADFSDSSMRGVNLEGANIENTNFVGTDLQGAMGLTWWQLQKAYINKRTKLPPYLREKAPTWYENEINRTRRKKDDRPFRRPNLLMTDVNLRPRKKPIDFQA